jgi:predicted TIM-barrel fold metal-dependent hydrolase
MGVTVTDAALRIISADCHVNEPPWVFDRVPAEYRDRAPKLVRGADGGDGWSFDGEPPKRTFGIEATTGKARSGKVSGLTFDEILPGNYDGAAHVADMDLDGVDVSIVYPANAIFTYIEPDRPFAMACMRSYNDWVLEEFQGAASRRIVGLPMLPVDDGMDVVLPELERVVGKNARAAFIPGLPRRPYHDPYYEPLWQAAASLGVPLTLHRTFGGKPDAADWSELVDQQVTAAGTVERFFSGVRPLTYMIFGGVFERNPDLKVVDAEVNMGWIPFWAEMMVQGFDNQFYQASGGVHLARKPSEFLGENVFVTVLDDFTGFKLIATDIAPWLADVAMFSSDYPHSVCLWPNTTRTAAELTEGLTEEHTRKIMSENARRVYHLE